MLEWSRDTKSKESRKVMFTQKQLDILNWVVENVRPSKADLYINHLIREDNPMLYRLLLVEKSERLGLDVEQKVNINLSDIIRIINTQSLS